MHVHRHIRIRMHICSQNLGQIDFILMNHMKPQPFYKTKDTLSCFKLFCNVLGEEIVRRCVAGCKVEDALSGSNPIQLPAKPIKTATMKMTAGM